MTRLAQAGPRPVLGTLRRWALFIAMGVAGEVSAQPVLHEYVEIDSSDALVRSADDAAGTWPAAALRPGAQESGEAEPDEGAPPDQNSAPAAASPDAELPQPGEKFSIDRDTTRPEQVAYEDPFTPTIVPFKRGVVFDSVNSDGDLLVADSRLTAVPKLARPSPSDEHFHAALNLEVRAGVPTPIPSVAPGARLALANAEPALQLDLAFDSAENWFVRSRIDRQIRLTLQLVADRRVFGSPYRDADWSDFEDRIPQVPAVVKRAARDVALVLGISESQRPEPIVSTLIQHFRRFRPSARLPAGRGLSLYRELALTGRGVCRHRAYAFTVTALGLGIPTRMAMNEAHAWVEIFDGEIWHRVDLGGAAEQLAARDDDRPRHVESRDPFAWPNPEESGNALATRRSSASPSSPGSGGDGSEPSGARSASGTSDNTNGAGQAAARADGVDDPNSAAPGDTLDRDGRGETFAEPAPAPDDEPREPAAQPARSEVLFRSGARRAERGKSLLVSGSVRAEGHACSGAWVEVSLRDDAGQLLPLGTLVSDARGQFQGQLVVPWNAALGEHALVGEAHEACSAKIEVR